MFTFYLLNYLSYFFAKLAKLIRTLIEHNTKIVSKRVKYFPNE